MKRKAGQQWSDVTKLEKALIEYYRQPIVRDGDEKTGRKPGLVAIAEKYGLSKSSLHRWKQLKEDEILRGNSRTLPHEAFR